MAETLRVLISSTAIDLKEHRQAVSDAILRLKQLPVGMEHFGAIPRPPLEVCREEVVSSDVVVAMVAHRYGWVPSEEQGGDGTKSITWYEVGIALDEGIPVLAYLVDTQHAWPQAKEQDLLTVPGISQKEMVRIGKNVQALKEFQAFLKSDAGLTCDFFTTPDDLAKRVVASLANVQPCGDRRADQPPARPPASYGFHIYHPLQPAAHFRGREDILCDLRDWWRDPAHADRVKSLVAIGGAGKTAIAAEFLSRIQRDRLSGHVFLWSFYEDPNTDSFLYEACAVFAGEKGDRGAGGRLTRLERALRDGAPHLFLLDGLERIQSEGKANRAFGELDDHQLKNFLRCIAGGLGRTRALVTTRFKMTDLKQWEHAGHRTYELQRLDEPSAVAVFKGWGVLGSDERLSALAGDLGYHALSVSVLGSFLHEFAGGDPDKAPGFHVDKASEAGAEGAKLGRILAGYAEALPKSERDLLVRLSVFPRGVSVKILGYLVSAGGTIAGQLVGADDAELLKIARKLARLGLVFEYQYGTADDVRFTAHPFLRDYFRQLVGVEEAKIHETVRSALAPSLETRPDSKPRDKETLDRYEELIEYTLGAGDVETAFELYINAMGRATHLGPRLGEFARGVRILSRFGEVGEPERVSEELNAINRCILAHDRAFFALSVGDLAVADRAFAAGLAIVRSLDSALELSASLVNMSFLLKLRGSLLQSEAVATQALDAARRSNSKEHEESALSMLACAIHLLGEGSRARELFARATVVIGVPRPVFSGSLESEHHFDLGAVDEAREQTERTLTECSAVEANNTATRCHYLLGLLALPTSTREATKHLGSVREWADRTGHMEAILQGHHLASEIDRASGDLNSALDEAETGLTLAEGCGFGLLAIKLLLSLSRAYLHAPDHSAALGKARDALERSRHKDCRYAWGEADAAHLCGVAHLRLGERELAKRRFAEALEVRQRIEHPRADETRAELDKLG